EPPRFAPDRFIERMSMADLGWNRRSAVRTQRAKEGIAFRANGAALNGHRRPSRARLDAKASWPHLSRVCDEGARPLEGDEALLNGERPLEHDGPHIALTRDRAARLQLRRRDPTLLTAHPAEQREVALQHHGHGPNLDRVLVSHTRSPSGVRAEHTWE